MKLKYKSYIAKVTFSAITCSFHGEVINLPDPINKSTIVFLASHKQFLPEVFREAVEQHLGQTTEELAVTV